MSARRALAPGAPGHQLYFAPSAARGSSALSVAGHGGNVSRARRGGSSAQSASTAPMDESELASPSRRSHDRVMSARNVGLPTSSGSSPNPGSGFDDASKRAIDYGTRLHDVLAAKRARSPPRGGRRARSERPLASPRSRRRGRRGHRRSRDSRADAPSHRAGRSLRRRDARERQRAATTLAVRHEAERFQDALQAR